MVKTFMGQTAALAMALAASITLARAAPAPLVFGTTGARDATNIGRFIAHDPRDFQAEGLSVDWVTAGSSAKLAQQTVAGSINVALAASDQTARAVNQGASLKIVDGAVRAPPFRVLGQEDFAGWSDVAGKTVSVGGASDQTLYVFRVMARRNGLKDGSSDFLYAGTTPSRYAQLASGGAAAAVLTNPLDV